MTRHRTWRSMVVGGTLLAAVALHAAGAAGQTTVVVQTSPPTYGIPLRDGNTAIVWWDGVSDPAHPGWRCEVPALWGGGAIRTITTLTAPAGDWRAALTEARGVLKGRAAGASEGYPQDFDGSGR
jgi:hypothetical protein